MQISVLNKLGIGYMEMRGVNGKNVSDYTPEEMKEIKKALDMGGIKVSSEGSPIGKIGVNDDFDAHMAKLKNTIEIAKILETKYIRWYGPDDSITLDKIRQIPCMTGVVTVVYSVPVGEV